MPKIKTSRTYSPFALSIIFHMLAIYFLILFPPSKAIVFFKIHKKSKEALSSNQEKIIEEISVVTIPKKHSVDNLKEVLSEEIGTLSDNEPITSHIDFRQFLTESIDFSFPIDTNLSFSLPPTEKIERPLESYLTPMSYSISEELLNDEEPKASTFEPHIKPPVSDQTIPSHIAQIDDYGLPEVTKMMPEMLDAELFTYKDASSDQYFKMELKIKEHKLFPETAQEFLFIIDLTQKNAKKNLPIYKDAIFKAIKLLKKNDKFNIATLNRSLNFLYPESSFYKSQDQDKLDQDFKKMIHFNGKFKDVIKHLATIFDKTEENELHTHCLFFTEEPSHDKESFLNLSKYAHSKLSVYPISYSEDKLKRETLNLFVESMNGKILTPPTKASFSRKFNALILDIKKTRLRNVSIKLDSEQGPVDLKIAEKTKQLTLQKPLKIFGKLNGQKNLKLQIIGSHGDDLFEMTKNLSIQGAKKGSSLIKQEIEKP